MLATSRRGDAGDRERVRVFVRLRPMRNGEGDATIRTDADGRRLWLAGERNAERSAEPSVPLQFDYDGILPADIAQQDVYEAVARPLVDAATAGHSACLMCYGQTGTGKTYTFGGGECLRTVPRPERPKPEAAEAPAEAPAARAAAAPP